MLNRTEILSIINSGDRLRLVYEYCIEKGKNELRVSQFVSCIVLSPHIQSYCFDYALTYYAIKYNIILLHDRNGNFIKAF